MLRIFLSTMSHTGKSGHSTKHINQRNSLTCSSKSLPKLLRISIPTFLLRLRRLRQIRSQRSKSSPWNNCQTTISTRTNHQKPTEERKLHSLQSFDQSVFCTVTSSENAANSCEHTPYRTGYTTAFATHFNTAL